jgi:hypothetical protein
MSRDETTARRAVTAAMHERTWNPTDIARESGVDVGTVSDFLSGQRWPRAATRARIERALSWPPGAINDIAAGRPVNDVLGDGPQLVPVEMEPGWSVLMDRAAASDPMTQRLAIAAAMGVLGEGRDDPNDEAPDLDRPGG